MKSLKLYSRAGRWIPMVLLAVGCAGSRVPEAAPAPSEPQPAANAVAPVDRTSVAAVEPVLPPRLAMLAGLMPLRTLGADTFLLERPTYDGRGVLIGILDGGLDPTLPGLRTTTTGQQKVIDLRDFSAEGRIGLVPLESNHDGSIDVQDHTLTGFGRVARIASGPYYGGIFRERMLGALPEADVNGNGQMTDEFPVVVAKASNGWIAVTDTDGDGALDDERPVRDYAAAAETFAYRADSTSHRPGPMTIAVNFSEESGRPVLDFFMDNSGHGSHVAGIAAGHNLFGVEGFNGVAPGAQLLGLKIANNARGGISVTGSMLRAMNYAADYASRRELPLILNLSFGVGNEIEGSAAIDSLIDEFALKHPDVLFVISGGNDGPGISTLGFPGSAAFALSVCALFPGVFAQPLEPSKPSPADVLGWWSSRGGELAKPDLCAPGVAFSNVPAWQAGEEISGGTSMAAPQVAGAAALLLSALQHNSRTVRAIDLKRALMATASPLAGTTALDEGAGVPSVPAAHRWLLAAHQTGIYAVRALTEGGNTSTGSGAYRRSGLANPGDTIQRFVVTSVGGQPAARLLLHSDTPWLRAPAVIEPGGEPLVVSLTYDAAALAEPGIYVGSAWAKAATDTTGGPSFGLTNTVIVPHTLRTQFRTKGMLTPGAVARYFFDVPEESGGLTVRLAVPGPAHEASLYLFEPSGRPYRGESSVQVGGKDSTTAAVIVSSGDLVAGVYEAVVVAPPAAPAQYELVAAVPEVAITAIGTGPSAVLRNRTAQSLSASLAATLAGAVRSEEVRGTGAAPVVIHTPVPEWATTMTVDVGLPVELWHALTDFGVTVFDSTGRRVSDGPLHYAFGRQTIELDSTLSGATVDVELFPGFAHLDPPDTWSAELQIVFTAPDPEQLAVLGQSHPAQIELPPHGSEGIQFSPISSAFEIPTGFAPLVEVTLDTEAGPAAIRRGPVGR